MLKLLDPVQNQFMLIYVKVVSKVLILSFCTRNERTASPVVVRVQVDDVEAAVDKAVKAGAQLVGEIREDTVCGGGKLGALVDPFGLSWIAVSPPQDAPEVEA